MQDQDDAAALRQFDRLLARRSTESEFQALFATYPRILSLSLPLRLEPSNIRPLGRPGKTEPDFLIVPDGGATVSYGVVELKRPDHHIFSRGARKELLLLSREAAIAVAQTRFYLAAIDAMDRTTALIVGNPANAFIIMGMSDEIAQATESEILRRQFDGLLPEHCQILPYDFLYRSFAELASLQVLLLTPLGYEPSTAAAPLDVGDPPELAHRDPSDIAEDAIVIAASRDRILEVLLDFARYPSWARDLKGVVVEAQDKEGRPTEVTFQAAAMGRSSNYTLRYDHRSAPEVLSWQLIRGDIVRRLDGAYRLVPMEGNEAFTVVEYRLQVDLVVPLPGFVRRRAEHKIVATALRELKDAVE